MLGKNDINQQIEDTLNSLEGMHRAEANPFIYTRIRARIQRSRGAVERLVTLAGKPAFAIMLLVVVLTTNAIVMLQSSSETTAVKQQQTQFAVADEYHLEVSSLYDYDNPEP
jgi:hypothetical protein